jgi:hypothetical protein
LKFNAFSKRGAIVCTTVFALCNTSNMLSAGESLDPSLAKKSRKSDVANSPQRRYIGTAKDQEADVDVTSLDVNKPVTWMTAVKKSRQLANENAARLISVALNEDRSDEDRRSAITAIGCIDSDASRKFLVENITLYIEKYIITGGDYFEQWPCAYALMTNANWSTSQAILEAMSTRKSDDELLLFDTPFAAGLGHRRAIAVLDNELRRSENLVRKENIVKLRRYVSQR